MTADESTQETEASLADEPEVRQALADGNRGSVVAVVADHPSSPLAWTELADIADSEGRVIEAFAFASVAAEFARDQLAASGWEPGAAVPWSDERNRPYLRALDTQRRAAIELGLHDRAARLAGELSGADPDAPARIASEFTPTQLISVVTSAQLFEAAAANEAHTAAAVEARTGEPLAEPAVLDAAGED